VVLRKEAVSNARINREINAIKAFFTRAHKWGWIPASPAADLPHLPEVKSRPARYLTEEEIGRLLEAMAGTDFEGLVLLALNLGLRVGELCNLTWEDLDFQNRLLHVTAKPDWQPKSYQERSRELNPPTLAWLRQERARCFTIESLCLSGTPGAQARQSHRRNARRPPEPADAQAWHRRWRVSPVTA
jgi:integrase